MAVRLLECRRVLKSTGSIYIHCDDRANSYLRLLLDAVFGAENRRNEIVWNRSGGRSDSKKWGRVSDRILFYTKSSVYTWNQQYQPLDQEYVSKTYIYDDGNGRGPYRKLPLHAAGVRTGESGTKWNEYDPGLHNRHWATPTKGNMHNFIVDHDLIPSWPKAFPSVQDRLDALDASGLVVHSDSYLPEIKTYLSSSRGVAAKDFIDDVPMAAGNESTGYATQKPLELYERIIKASSNSDDVVLDIFAGCATTAVAAQRLGRQWVACDMAYRSWTMLKRRFYLNGIALEGMGDSTKNALASVKKDKGFQEPQQWTTSSVVGPNELPNRDDVDPAPPHHLVQSGGSSKKTTQSATWSGQISKEDAKKLLIERFGPVCWGCGYEPKRPNGSLDDTLLEVDHIRARKAAEGVQGDDELYNLAMLHRTCNGVKRNRLTLEELRKHNADNKLLYVETTSELVDLFEATQFSHQAILQHVTKHGVQGTLPTA